MRLLVLSALALAISFSLGHAASSLAQAQTLGPEGTPQVESSSEGLRYAEGATPQALVHYWIVVGGVDSFPQLPSPQDAKETDLRKRILDLRLIMDFNAYVYDPGLFEAYRDAIDATYEQVGQYKDLFDIQEIDRAPIPPGVQAERLAKMNVALAPFRLGSFREDLKSFFYQRADAPLGLERKNQPRLWQIAQVGPTDSVDSVGNAALLGHRVLRNLRNEGLTVADVFDPAQEAHFHDVRKALRSVMVLSDMFPTLAAATSDVREPLSRAVKAYGKVNDQYVAYHAAQETGRELDARAAGLRDAYAKAQVDISQLVESGALEAYAATLEAVQGAHGR